MIRARSALALLVALLAIPLAPSPAHAAGDGSIFVPMPMLGDAAAYEAEGPLAVAGPGGLGRAFSWVGTETSADEWGRPVDVDVARVFEPVTYSIDDEERLVWQDAWSAYAGGSMSTLTLTRWSNDTQEWVPWLLGVQPLEPSRGRAEHWTNFTLFGQYADAGCFLRHYLQGRTLDVGFNWGDTPGSFVACPLERGLPGLGDLEYALSGYRTVETSFRGRAAVAFPFEGHMRMPGAGEVPVTARIVYADGIPYPAEFELVARPPGRDEVASRLSLAYFSRGDVPLLPDAPARPELASRPDARFLPPSRAGPADEGAAFPFPLEAAVAEVERDLTLARFQAWRLTHPRSLVVEADLEPYPCWPAYDAPPPTSMTTPRCPKWDVTFGEGTSRFIVRSQLLPGVGGAPGTARNGEVGEYEDDEVAPRAEDLPERVLAWDSAVAAWGRHAPRAFASSTANFASYRVSAPPTAGVPAPVDIAVGHAPPDENRYEPGTATSRSAAVALDAHTGLAHFVDDRAGTWRYFAALPIAPDALDPASAAGGSAASWGASLGLAGGVAAASLVAALLAALAYARGWLAPLFTRLTRQDVMDNALRQTLLDAVAREPGIHLGKLVALTGAGNGAVTHHLRTLEREGLVTSIKLPGYRRYFVPGAVPRAEMLAAAELASESARAVYDAVRASPGIRPGEVAARVGVSPPAVHKTLGRLERAGLVRRERSGASVRLVATEPPRGRA